VTPSRQGSAIVEYPNDLEIVIKRTFQAPIQLVFDVFTKTEHLRNTLTPFGEEITECSFDARVGGTYHYVFIAEGREMSFRGDYVDVQPPTKIVNTWVFEGWPGVEALESLILEESDGVTTMRWSLAFKDKAGRDHMTSVDGIEASFDNVEEYLRSISDLRETVAP
jgi:uncharacterized protein YndB with AHSA1/START domain